MEIANSIGIIGVSLVLVAYFMNQVQVVSACSLNYSLLNLVGAILILYSLFHHWNLASVIIECAWILISLIGLARYMKAKGQKEINS